MEVTQKEPELSYVGVSARVQKYDSVSLTPVS